MSIFGTIVCTLIILAPGAILGWKVRGWVDDSERQQTVPEPPPTLPPAGSGPVPVVPAHDSEV